MAPQVGLEPTAYCLEGSYSIQLSYWGLYFLKKFATLNFDPGDVFLVVTRISTVAVVPLEKLGVLVFMSFKELFPETHSISAIAAVCAFKAHCCLLFL